MMGLLTHDQADIVLSGFTLSPMRIQAIDLTVGYDYDWEGWVAPNPEALPTYLSLIKPLQPLVWLLMVVTLVVVGISIHFLATREGNWNGRGCPHDWKTIRHTCWYCFGTLLGEAITRDTKSESLPGLR